MGSYSGRRVSISIGEISDDEIDSVVGSHRDASGMSSLLSLYLSPPLMLVNQM